MDRSVRQSVDPVRRGVHGPGVSVFGSPSELSILMVLENQLRWDRDNLHLVTLTCKKWLKIFLLPFHIWHFHPALDISRTSEKKIRTR